MRNARRLLLIVAALLAATACQATKSDFERQASDTGAELAAASRTLRAVHEGRLDVRYARASFANYEEQLSGVDSQVSSAEGTSAETRQRLLELYRRARPAIEAPCLDGDCDWRSQLQALDAASAAFTAAGG